MGAGGGKRPDRRKPDAPAVPANVGAGPTTEPTGVSAEDREFWLSMRQALFIQIAAIEKRHGLAPKREK